MGKQTKKTPLQNVIFDTDVLIWYFRGSPQARQIMESCPPECRLITSVNLMELFQGCRNQQELLDVQGFIAQNFKKIIHPRTSISEKAIHLVSQFALSHGLRVIDAIIASSALLSRAKIVTGNTRHFRFIPGIDIKNFTN